MGRYIDERTARLLERAGVDLDPDYAITIVEDSLTTMVEGFVDLVLEFDRLQSLMCGEISDIHAELHGMQSDLNQILSILCMADDDGCEHDR